MNILKSIALSALLPLSGSVSAAVIIDAWDMNDNGTWQNSDNDTNLGGHYKNDLTVQQFPQTDDDGVFLFSPVDASGFGGKSDFSSVADLTDGVVTLSMTYSAMNWSTNPTGNNKMGLRLWDSSGSNYVGLSFEDSSDKIFAFTKSSAGLGALSEKTGRLINGLSDDTTPRTVFLELDYAASEVRMYADNWQWIPSSQAGNPVFTTTVDFASAGMTDVGKFQTFYQNWGVGDTVTMDNISISFDSLAVIPEPSSLAFLFGLVGILSLLNRRRR